MTLGLVSGPMHDSMNVLSATPALVPYLKTRAAKGNRHMPKFVRVLLYAVVGFVVAAVAGYFLVGALSSNQHDVAVEAAMTSIFVLGPIGALVGGGFAFFKSGG